MGKNNTPQQQRELRWGIVGCGRISGDFVRAMEYCQSGNKVVAVASADSLERARQFCEKNGLNQAEVRCYGTHEQLFADSNIDVVYVGNLTHQHKAAVLGALKGGKHVLCEKTLGVNRGEVQEMVTRARGKARFLMEGYWMRCFPIWREIMTKYLPEIGPIQLVQCDFGFPVNRVNSADGIKDGGEGYLLATGCYALTAVQMVFGGEQKPVDILARGGKKEGNSFDLWANIQLQFADQKLAQVFYSGQHKTAGSLTIFGQKGNIRIPEFFWSPVEAEVQRYPADGVVRRAGICPVERIARPLPPFDPNLFYYPHAVGLAYEIDHVNECIGKGKMESDLMGLDESEALAGIMDEVRRQIGVKYPQDKWQ